jgi:geranylgeranyl diphosphate synthase type I
VIEAPPTLAEIGSRAAGRIDDLLIGELARWRAIDGELAEPFEALRVFVAGAGKRLRPAFCHWGFVAAGGDPASQAVVDAGAALELLHTCALIHDDVMDGSRRRRGQATVHVDFSERHRLREWRGDRERFGTGAAILIGDLAFVYADVLLRDAPRAAVEVFADLRLEVNVGQYLDLQGTATGRPSLSQARTIAIYKSGKYTIERPLHLGAAMLGRERLEELAGPLSRYGVPLGEAFQLRDDLLGAFGDEAVLGKGVGDDFREGKPTALYALALERAQGAAARLLHDRFGEPDLTLAEMEAMKAVLTETGARRAVEDEVDRLAGEALTALAEAPIEEAARTELQHLAAFIIGRDR